jgi:CTP:molybdopterin cytidylyltransferase MocA
MVGAVVLAAGAATRFGAPKQRLLLPYVLEALGRSAGLQEIVVAAGAYPLEAPPATANTPVRVVVCADWALGPGASLRCGLAALGPQVAAALVVLADGPYLDPLAIERVLAHRGEAAIVAASYDGVRSHPALFSRAAWSDVPDDGGRSLPALLVSCDDLTPPGDIDTPDRAEGL